MANPDAFDLEEGQLLDFDLTLNDTDANGDNLIISDIDGLEYIPGSNSSRFYGSGLTVRISSAGEVSFEADDPFGNDLLPGETAEFVIPYTVTDSVGGFASSTVTITVTGKDEATNTAPVAVADAVALDEGGSIFIDAAANDTDADNDVLTLTGVNGATNGSATIEAGQVRYTPNADYNGSETLSYEISDGQGGAASGAITVTVNPVNDVPEVANDTAALDEDGTILIDAIANDTDIDGDTLTLTGVSGATNGTATIDGNQISYTPNADFNGSETLTYTVTDNNGGTGTGTVNVTVNAVNDAPIADGESFDVGRNGTLVLSVAQLLEGDTDVDGDALSITDVSAATNGTVTLDDQGDADPFDDEIRFTPDADYSGSAGFEYAVSDGNGGTAVGTVSVTVAEPVTTTETTTFDDGRVLETTFVDGVKTTEVMTDVADAFAFASYTDSFDPDGNRVSRDTFYDDGREAQNTYVGGVIASSLVTDVADEFVWDTVERDYDATGTQTSQTNTYDDGRLLVTAFTNGVRSSAEMSDLGNAYAWTSYSDSFDANGDLAMRTITFDDGRISETTSVGGVTSSSTDTDTGNAFAWSTIVRGYDAEGMQVSQTTTYDDGRILETAFTDGVRSSTMASDLADAYSWLSYTDSFAANGDRTSRTTIYDDGRETENTYVDGALASSFTTDAADQFVWNTVEKMYDANGAITGQTNTYDDGRLLEVMFANGIRSTATMTDVDDVYAWTNYVDTYDANGDLATRTTLFDDGREVFNDFMA